MPAQVEAIYTPNGFLKTLRLHPSIEALSEQPKRRAIVAACAEARNKVCTTATQGPYVPRPAVPGP